MTRHFPGSRSGLRATAYAPGSIGNVGPGFDVLGLAIDGIGDRVTVELTHGPSRVIQVSGTDADLIPLDPGQNCAAIAANHLLEPFGYRALVTIEKGLLVAAGLGGSAASSVAGAYAAALALGQAPVIEEILDSALAGESAVAGRHLDNIAASVTGGLALTRSVEPIDVVKLATDCEWWLALVTPRVRIRTREARALLPPQSDRSEWTQLMANCTGVVHAFASADAELLRRALVDVYAEPHRAPLIPHFHDVKTAAFDAGALACSISGSGPTVFAVAESAAIARQCASAMQRAFAETSSTAHVGGIAKEGVRRVE